MLVSRIYADSSDSGLNRNGATTYLALDHKAECMADVATVLFSEFLKFNPAAPNWPDRDRFVLSAGHGSMLLYALLHLTGYPDMTLADIKNFRQLGAKTAGHPEFGHAAGIETTTGPLGQGLANAVGMALAEKMLAARHGEEIIDHYTYVIAGDGCLMEGISQEAISMAGHLRLNKLIVLWDDNEISIDGATNLSVSDDQLARFKASGWAVDSVDGHNEAEIRVALTKAKKSDRPVMIACKTTIGYGAPNKAGTSGAHGSALGAAEVAGAREKLGWEHAPFEIPDNVLKSWCEAGKRSLPEYKNWEARFDALKPAVKSEFERVQAGKLPDIAKAMATFKRDIIAKKPKEASRQSSGHTLEILSKAIPELLGGSADLTGSNLTKTADMKGVSGTNFAGNYIYYGVREHAMGAVMNGLALHRGFIPYGGTFLAFSDYARPAMRLSALMGVRVIYVMTHDSIGLGEDGPTHQPVEHLAALRAIPNLNVFRPCDAYETAECWELALENAETPSVLVLSRQGLPLLRQAYSDENQCAMGGYVLFTAKVTPQISLIATGSEVSIAMEVREKLLSFGLHADVVSMPCTELFDAQSENYKKKTLRGKLKVAIEAAVSYGWERYIGSDGLFIGMPGFGASAPAPELYKHFGITAENIVKRIQERLTKKG